MATKNLLIVIATNNVDSIMKFPLLYGGVSIPRNYWKRVHIMFWGASIKVVAKNKEIKEKVNSMIKDGVEFSSCIVCAQEYNAVKKLKKIGITSNHTGELLTKALKNKKTWSVMTI